MSQEGIVGTMLQCQHNTLPSSVKARLMTPKIAGDISMKLYCAPVDPKSD